MKRPLLRSILPVALAILYTFCAPSQLRANTVNSKEYSRAMELLTSALKEISGGKGGAKQDGFSREVTQAKVLLDRAALSASKEVDALEAKGKRDTPEWTAAAQVAMTCAFASDALALALEDGKKSDWKGASALLEDQLKKLQEERDHSNHLKK